MPLPYSNNAILSPSKIKLILTDFLVKRKSRSVKKSLADIIIVQHLIYFKHLLIQSINQENVIHPLSLKFKILPTLMLPQNFEIISNSPISSSPIKVNRNRGGAFYVSGTSKNLLFNSYVSWTLSSCQDHHMCLEKARTINFITFPEHHSSTNHSRVRHRVLNPTVSNPHHSFKYMQFNPLTPIFKWMI